MKATLRNYRQSPRKVALVAGLVRGKTAGSALTQLKFTTKRASSPVVKLLESAIANAKNSGVSNPESLIIKEIRVDKGMVLKRMMPRARGSAARILKRSSHIMLTLADAGQVKLSKAAKTKATKAPKAPAKKATKKTVEAETKE